MGSLLDKPKTEYLEAEEGEANGLKYGVSSMQGWRTEMEDAHIISHDLDGLDEHSLFGVFDGHGGQEAAKYAAQHLTRCLLKTESFAAYQANPAPENCQALATALEEAFLLVDKEMREEFKPETNPMGRSGCTAIAAVVTRTHILCANAGDSRALLSRAGANVPLSHDHKPWNEVEKTRIQKAGGCVSMKRVDGELAVSRALGDFQYKECADPKENKVTAFPDVIVLDREDSDEFIVLACDGIYDVMENTDVITAIKGYTTQGEKRPQLMAEELMCDCLSRHSRDNMSVIVVLLPAGQAMLESETGDGVEGMRQRREARALQEAESRASRGDEPGKNPMDV